MNELNENKVYKQYIQSMLSRNEKDFCPFRYEKQMDYLFSFLGKDFELKNQNILEAGSGYGRLIYFLNEFDSNQSYWGLDYVEELVLKGNELFKDYKNIKFEHENLLTLPPKYEKFFDISISYKVFVCLPYYETALQQLINVTKNKIFITMPMFDGDIDYICKVYPQASQKSDMFLYWNIYSLPRFEKFCRTNGAKSVKFVDMKLDIDLRLEDINKIQTYTVLTDAQQRLEIMGCIVSNWKLVEIIL